MFATSILYTSRGRSTVACVSGCSHTKQRNNNNKDDIWHSYADWQVYKTNRPVLTTPPRFNANNNVAAATHISVVGRDVVPAGRLFGKRRGLYRGVAGAVSRPLKRAYFVYLPGVQTRDGTVQSARHRSHRSLLFVYCTIFVCSHGVRDVNVIGSSCGRRATTRLDG